MLDILFGGLDASPVAWKPFMDAYKKTGFRIRIDLMRIRIRIRIPDPDPGFDDLKWTKNL